MWTPNEDQFLKDNYSDMFAKDIAKHLGKTINIVRKRAFRLGLATKFETQIKHTWTEEELVYIRSNIQNISIKEVMNRFNLTRGIAGSKIREIKREFGLYKHECLVCKEKFQDVKGRTRHITTSSDQNHQQLVAEQEELLTKYFTEKKGLNELLNDPSFLFGRDWVHTFSRKSFTEDWMHNKESKRQHYICAQCKKGFDAYRLPGEVDRIYCSNKCAVKSNSFYEPKALDVIDKILEEKSIRNKMYKWMRSPKGRPLEIDGYYPQHNLAVEYQGEQHYISRSPLFDLQYRQECDTIKRQAIKSRNIMLLEIKYDEPLTEEHLRIRLEELGVLQCQRS